MPAPADAQRHESNIPIPDPSILTTEALDKAVAELRAFVGDGQKALREILETRLGGMDKAIQLLQDTADKFPAWVDEKIAALRDVNEQRFVALTDTTAEKFSSIQTQFTERDVRTEQAAGAVKIAVDAALQAQKEAAGEQNRSNTLAQTKSETATTKQIDQMSTLIQNVTKAFDDKIGDVKDRLTRIEGKGEVADPQRVVDAATIQQLRLAGAQGAGKSEGFSASWAILIAAVVLVGALLSVGTRVFTPPAATAPQVIYVPAPSQTVQPSTAPAAPR
jgi:hypothetical protein